MLSKLNKKAQGFTIIEVLIVLAIAGLILLIVFLAVPALQRNSRNTSRRNDIAAVLGAYQEFVNNNGAVAPANALGADCADITKDCGKLLALAKRGIYKTDSNVTISTIAVDTVNNTALDTLPQIRIIKAAKCSTTTLGDATFTSGDRNVVILYSVEGSSGSALKQCQES